MRKRELRACFEHILHTERRISRPIEAKVRLLECIDREACRKLERHAKDRVWERRPFVAVELAMLEIATQHCAKDLIIKMCAIRIVFTARVRPAARRIREIDEDGLVRHCIEIKKRDCARSRSVEADIRKFEVAVDDAIWESLPGRFTKDLFKLADDRECERVERMPLGTSGIRDQDRAQFSEDACCGVEIWPHVPHAVRVRRATSVESSHECGGTFCLCDGSGLLKTGSRDECEHSPDSSAVFEAERSGSGSNDVREFKSAGVPAFRDMRMVLENLGAKDRMKTLEDRRLAIPEANAVGIVDPTMPVAADVDDSIVDRKCFGDRAKRQ